MGIQPAVVKQVRAAFERERRINLHRYPIQIDFQDGTLTLDGEAEHIAAKKIGLALAMRVHGVLGIVDRLRVAPAERMGDGAVRDLVRDALVQEPAFQECAIRVKESGQATTFEESIPVIEVAVEEGVVTLDGQVRSLCHKRLAGVLAWWVPGSRDVVNGLEVVPPEDDSDEEVTEALRIILEKDPLVNAAQIRVSTRGYVVTLDGMVTTEREKTAAEFDAWYVFGVDKVIDNLRVQR
jgi:osmotically-inducible protein OsmY